MSFKPNEELDPHFEAELEKAKALSMETYELEQIRQKRFSQTSATTSSHAPGDVLEYRRYLEKKIGRPLSGGNNESWQPPPSSTQPRRVSEVIPPSSFNTKSDNDLMDFNAPSPEKPKDPESEARSSFIQFVDQMHKLNTQLSSTVAIRPQAGFAASVPPQGTYGNTQTTQIVPQNFNRYGQMYPSLVEQQRQEQQKSALTPDELQRLYGLNQAMQPYNPQPYTVPQYSAVPFGNPSATYATTLYQMTPPAILPINAPKLPPRNPAQIYQVPPALPPRNVTPAPSVLSIAPSTSNASISVSAKSDEVKLRRKSTKEKNPNGDLIDLDNGMDDSRVSVLEAFDPLLNEDRSSSDDDKESVQSSYYSEYDPFDYIYSSGTQYSDPVYDAVNRADKTPGSPSSAISRPIGFYLPNTLEHVDDEPPPPLPPRITPTEEVQKGFSLDYRRRSTKLYQDVVQRRMYERELVAFYEMVKDLRATYKYDDEETNVGHVKALEIDSQYAVNTSLKLLVYPEIQSLINSSSSNRGPLEGYGPPIQFTCDITTAVEHVIMHVVCELEGQIKGTVADYMLKTIGSQEWLSPCTILCHLECVHNCMKLEQDVKLGLCRKDPKVLHVISRSQQDDVRDAEILVENILPKEPSSSINYDQLIILLETLETEIDKLESAASDTTTRVLSCAGVLQAVKAICALLGSIDTAKISQSINDLKTICDQGHRKYVSSDTMVGGRVEVVSDQGNYAEVTLRPKSVFEALQHKCDQLRDAIRNLLDIYTHAFRVNFWVSTTSTRMRDISILTVTKPVMIHVNYLHRIPVTWKYDDYMLGAQIYHGARYLGYPLVTQSNNESCGIYPRLKFDSWLKFDNIPVCTLPREARLIFVLYGCVKETNEADQGNQTGQQKITKIELGWTAVQFFDFERKMIENDLLLPLWPPTPDKYFCPAPGKGTHPLGTYYPVLGIQVADYKETLVYPEPRANIPPALCLDFNSLDINLQQELIDTAEQGYPLDKLDKREVLWEKRYYLHKLPHALAKILHAAYSWDYNSVGDLHGLLHAWTPLEPLQSMELLLPRYPDLEVRKVAVKWFSKISNDQLIDFLPQLLQALKHDTYEASPLARFLLCRALESPRVAHHLYWLLAQSLPGDAPQNENEMAPDSDPGIVIQARYHRRYRLMLRALLSTCGEKLSGRFLYQNMMCKVLTGIAITVINAKESLRLSHLRIELEKVNQLLQTNPTALPLGPGLEVTGVSTQNSSYFNSNTLPLKIYFMGPDKSLLPAIFKYGDDLQQDMLTLQIVRIMDKLWLQEGLDLKMVTFGCVPTGDKRGMIEMVSDAETLRKIQVEWGLTGSFKDKPIAEWLAKQNPSQLEYERAVANFTNSCAGYCVAMYILGVCDRHNDNIMLKTSGHLFHIDFGKFLGDAQMFGNFKRDRTPFVLTSDMVYVINGGDRSSDKFHYFVDLCCKAFNIVRKHGDLLMHMFALMATSGIPGVTTEAVTYVRNALLLGQSNPEAAASFAKMINISLQSKFTQFNFFLHNLAQMRFSSETEGGALLSFVPKVFTMAQEGRLKSVMVHGYQKRYDLEKYYVYILRVTRQNQPDPSYLFRSWKEFCEFHQKLCLRFPLGRFHSLQTGIHVGRSNIKTVAERRAPVIRQFLLSLFNSTDEIAHSDLVYTFFQPLLRDQQEADIHVKKVKDVRPITNPTERVSGEIKLSLQYHRGALTVMVHHARALPVKANGEEPNTYVKVYLKPDRYKSTKRKTKILRKNCYPTFMETLEYRMPLEVIQERVLQVTVWSHDSLQENEFLGGVELILGELNLKEEINRWFPLVSIPRSRV